MLININYSILKGRDVIFRATESGVAVGVEDATDFVGFVVVIYVGVAGLWEDGEADGADVFLESYDGIEALE